MTVLRPELVDAYWKFKMREWVNGELEKRRQNQTETTEPAKTLEIESTEIPPHAVAKMNKRLVKHLAPTQL
jgi:protein TIF31